MFDEQTLIQAKELREKTLKPAVLCKVCKLLKHDVSRWNEFFYSSERSQKIKDLLEEKDKVVIVGSSGLGKTRIVIEVLRQLSFEKKFNDMIVVAVDPSLETGKRPIIESVFGGNGLLLFCFSMILNVI
ncbi:MAG: hypothetical protein ACPLKZ_05620 [Candidatus Bathyarchaeales archaeon]